MSVEIQSGVCIYLCFSRYEATSVSPLFMFPLQRLPGVLTNSWHLDGVDSDRGLTDTYLFVHLDVEAVRHLVVLKQKKTCVNIWPNSQTHTPAQGHRGGGTTKIGISSALIRLQESHSAVYLVLVFI